MISRSATRWWRRITRPLVASLIAATALSGGSASAQEPEAVAGTRPGTLALVVGTLMLVIWAAAFGLALRRARRQRHGASTAKSS